MKQQILLLRLWTRANESQVVHLDELVEICESDDSMINPFESMHDDDPPNNWEIIEKVRWYRVEILSLY